MKKQLKILLSILFVISGIATINANIIKVNAKPLEEEKPQIYINNKWYTFVTTTYDELYEENCKEDKEISDLEFNIIKSLRDYVKENNKEYQQFF